MPNLTSWYWLAPHRVVRRVERRSTEGRQTRIACGGQFVEHGLLAVQHAGVEAFEGLVAAQASAPEAGGETGLLAPAEFVLEQQGEELGVAQVRLDGLPAASVHHAATPRSMDTFEHHRRPHRGSIEAIPDWLLSSDHQLARFTRSSNGSFHPITQWPD